MLSRELPLTQRFFFEQPANILAAAPAAFGPVCVPVRAVGALGAIALATADLLLAEADRRVVPGSDRPGPLKLGAGEDLEPSQIMFVEVLDRIEQVAVESHQATLTGAKSRFTVRRSVRVHPNGGVILSAWSAHSAYP